MPAKSSGGLTTWYVEMPAQRQTQESNTLIFQRRGALVMASPEPGHFKIAISKRGKIERFKVNGDTSLAHFVEFLDRMIEGMKAGE